MVPTQPATCGDSIEGRRVVSDGPPDAVGRSERVQASARSTADLRGYLTAIPICLLALASCSSSLANRARDAADIATFSFGYGLGARARVGPIGTGMFANRDLGGLRGGQADLWWGNLNDSFLTDVDLVAYRMEVFPAPSDAVERRAKDFMAVGIGPWTRTFVLPFGRPSPTPSFYTQLEIAVGCGPSLRAGLNPGEILDFLLGFIGVDLFGDDIEGADRE